jgi:hypothetical protein
MRNSKNDEVSIGLWFASQIQLAYWLGRVTKSRALNLLDRLALRMEEAGEPEAEEQVSAMFMAIV